MLSEPLGVDMNEVVDPGGTHLATRKFNSLEIALMGGEHKNLPVPGMIPQSGDGTLCSRHSVISNDPLLANQAEEFQLPKETTTFGLLLLVDSEFVKHHFGLVDEVEDLAKSERLQEWPLLL